jgi:hypothetical protein
MERSFMRITPKRLNISPYVSTSWDSISTLHAVEAAGIFTLHLILKDGHEIVVPNLDREAIDLIFSAHAKYIEAPLEGSQKKVFLGDIPLNLKSSPSEGPATFNAVEHNPDQADFPPLPPTILEKLTNIALAFGKEALQSLPKAVRGCHCIYCQLMHAIFGEEEEEVALEDLRFRDWEVEEMAEKLYVVKNPIEPNEYYNVYLGEPLGCTCGCKNCEHIRAVLST